MCDPATLIIAATAAQAAGQIQSGLYASAQAKYAAGIAEQNKQLSREAGDDSIKRGQDEQRRLGREVAQRVGKQEARMSANNIDVSRGSAGRVIEDTMTLAGEDAAAISENVARQVRSHQIDAWNYESEKRAAKAEAKQAKIATAFNVASTVLGGAQQYSKYQASQGG